MQKNLLFFYILNLVLYNISTFDYMQGK